ncbi:MAG: peptidase T [Acholeplasmataceae bacterium]|nr:peptidase T [Acholeplasmataceae bacterium]
MLDKDKLLKRFISYTEFETTSMDEAKTFPSSKKQLVFAKFLEEELNIIGLSDVSLDENGYLLATLRANDDGSSPAIGLIAHMDTSGEASGANVKPRLHTSYQGERIVLDSEKEIFLSPKTFPELLNYIGQDIVTTDGKTLLGADDKAGICEIVSACEYLIAHPELKHGAVKIAFTPDEEVGHGTDFFPLNKFGADFAYTIDGGQLGELNYETFNACDAKIFIKGRGVHPGSAKGKMINAITLAAEWQNELPAGERPEYTDGYEGFFHITKIKGNTDEVVMHMIIRDHNAELLEKKKNIVLGLVDFMNQKYGHDTIKCELKDVYVNMKSFFENSYYIVDRAVSAMEKSCVKPIIIPVRGGTDGARLSEVGLLCPNIFTGGHNFHGVYEYIPLQSMLKATEVIINLVSDNK